MLLMSLVAPQDTCRLWALCWILCFAHSGRPDTQGRDGQGERPWTTSRSHRPQTLCDMNHDDFGLNHAEASLISDIPCKL